MMGCVCAATVGCFFITAGTSKLLDISSAIDISRGHAIIPPHWVPLLITSHAAVSLILGTTLLFYALSRRYKWVLEASMAFSIISLIYLLVAIIKNGLDINCGCFPGLIESHSGVTALVMDSGLISLLYISIRLRLSIANIPSDRVE